MSDFTLTSKSLKNSITLKEKNYQSFEHKSNIGIRNQLNNIHPFNLETTFGRVKNNEYEISFTCNDEESKCTDNTNKKILDFLERKEFIYFNYDNFSIAKSKKKSLDKKKGIIENNEFNDFNNNNINIWKILFLLLINFIFITIIFINKYINMKNRITFLVFINNK